MAGISCGVRASLSNSRVEAERRQRFREEDFDSYSPDVGRVSVKIRTPRLEVSNDMGAFHELNDEAGTEPTPTAGRRTQTVFVPVLHR
ncbi:hypothetical protein [Bradyrhizobium tropiciagri]|uniref:hypothetical protein n=1 Tax=Bradyrhizobium tropiciagri TaxID=312253 RepID=UPI00067BF88B|nr:hypothetical protein [Bradyrhizobium tropiciagri]